MPNHLDQAPTAEALSIDTSNMYTDGVGTEGVTPDQVAALSKELTAIHNHIQTDTRHGLNAEFACLTLHEQMRAQLGEIKAMAAEIQQYRHVLVIGIGGSSLGCKAIRHALKPDRRLANNTGLCFIENIDPYHLEQIFATLNPNQVAIIAISKSGGTIETVVQYQIIRNWLETELGKTTAKQRQWLITDPTTGWLREVAEQERLPALAVPPKVGGRYSVLTPVGLLPLAVAGIDIEALLSGAATAASACQSAVISENSAMEMAALYFLLETTKDKHVSIMMPYINRLRLFADWYCQLWAESLGKRDSNKPSVSLAGSLPVRAMGAIDQHSQLQMYLESRLDKMFSFITLGQWRHDIPIPEGNRGRDWFPYLENKGLADVITAEFFATRQVITETGHPNLTITLPDLNAYALGQLTDLYQRVTIYTGLLYGINPLDQPSVEKGKKLAIDYLKSH